MQILIVDDSALVRHVLKNSLNKPKIFEAKNGQLAVEVLQNEKIDIMILDVHMPVMDGPKVLNIIRNDTSYDALYIIMATANNDKEQILKLIKQGIDGYLVKPLDEEGIFKALNTAMKKIR